MMRKMSGLLLGLTLIFSSAQAATIYVPDQYPTIQEAVDATAAGDEVIVRPGTYVENIYMPNRDITVRSEKGPEVTIVDGGYRDPVFWLNSLQTPATVIEGFTITHGIVGIESYRSSPTIRGNIISTNTIFALGGGGLAITGADPVVINNIFVDNTFTGSTGGGGAIECSDFSAPQLINNLFFGNSSKTVGGALYGEYGYPVMINNTIVGNSAVISAGGVYLGDTHWDTAEIHNTIIWGNTAPVKPDLAITTSTRLNMSYSDVGGWAGGTVIDADPLFVDLSGGDLHLTLKSPCRDAGTDGVPIEPFDFEGDPRPFLQGVDMGADEFHYHLYYVGEMIAGSPIDIRIVGTPNKSVLVALGSGVQNPPQQTPYGDLWLTLPLLNSWNVGPIGSTGVYIFSVNVPAGWQSGSEHPVQALVGNLGNPSSKLTNLMMLRVK